MTTTVKDIFDWEECDAESLALFMEKVSLDSSIPVTVKPLEISEDYSSKTKSNINNKENIEDNNLLTENKLLSRSDENSKETFNLPKEEVAFISDEETSISVKKETRIEVSNIIKSELSSDTSSDSDDADSLLTRGKEKTKKKSYRRKEYKRSTDVVNVKDLNQRSLQLLSSGYIVQNNAVDNILPLHPIQNVDSANFIDSSVYSPFNVSSPESGYDTQSSEVYSPSPPSTVPIFCNHIIEEEEESQDITDIILDIEEYLKTIDTKNPEVKIPGIDELERYDYIEQLKLIFKESDNEIFSQILDSDPSFNLEDSESLRNESIDFISLQSLLDGYETASNQSITTDSSLSELEYIYSESNMQNTTFSPCYSSDKPIKRKIYYKLNDIAKNQLKFSEDFNNEKYLMEIRKVLTDVREKKRCIYVEQHTEPSKRTTLHNAVLNSNIERIYCLIEMQKKMSDSIQVQINFRDIYKKTALNYAEDLKLPLIIDYLKENLAIKSV